MIFKIISNFIIVNFFWIWLSILILPVSYTIFYFIKERHSLFSQFKDQAILLKKTNLFAYSSTQQLIILLFGIFLVAYILVITYQQDFANYDNDVFTEVILKGYHYYFPIWPAVGRFFPLGHQEWHLWESLTKSQTPWVYFLFSIIQLLIIIILLFKIVSARSIALRCLIILLLITLPSIFQCFDTLTIPERNLLLCLTLFIVAFQAYLKTGLTFYGGIVLIVTQFALYYKEPVMILLGLFALTRMLSGIIKNREIYKRLMIEYQIEIFILSLCSIFIILYLLVNFPEQSLDYASERAVQPIEALGYYIRTNILLTLFLITFSLRILLFRHQWDQFWDALALGAIAYFFCYVKLGLLNSYYLAPVDFIALLYLSYLFLSLGSRNWSKLLGLTIAIVIVIQNIYLTPQIAINRINFMAGRIKITEFLHNYSQSPNFKGSRLYFPYAKDYQLYYLSCFLKYKQLQLANSYSSSNSQPLSNFIITSPLSFAENNQCVAWNKDHYCFQIEHPQSGDLIVILPDSQISEQQLSQWQNQGTLLLHYSSFPRSSNKDVYIFKIV